LRLFEAITYKGRFSLPVLYIGSFIAKCLVVVVGGIAKVGRILILIFGMEISGAVE
jgi:hypothetical protein